MLYNKERPYKFDGMVGQSAIVGSIREQSKKGRYFHAYLFVGQWGGGKTTMARILAASVRCQNKDEGGNPCGKCESCRGIFEGNCPDVLELDAASNSGVDSIRELKESACFLPQMSDKKVYIIDEVHMLSSSAWNALLKVLEEPPEHMVFILCTTEVKKVPNTVRSRCATYQFRQIGRDEMLLALEEICQRHGFAYDKPGLELIVRNAHGSLRDALSLLDQVLDQGSISEGAVGEILGVSNQEYLFSLLESLLGHRTWEAVEAVNSLEQMGKDLFLAANDLLEMATDGVMACMAGAEALSGTEHYRETLCQMAKRYSAARWSGLVSSLMEIREEIRKMPGHTSFLCGIIRMNEENTLFSLAERVERLEQALKMTSMESGEKENPILNLEEKIFPIPSGKNREPETMEEGDPVFVGENGEMEDATEEMAFGNFSFWPSMEMESCCESKDRKKNSVDAAERFIRENPEEKIYAACIESCSKIHMDGKTVYEAPYEPIEAILSAYDEKVRGSCHRLKES